MFANDFGPAGVNAASPVIGAAHVIGPADVIGASPVIGAEGVIGDQGAAVSRCCHCEPRIGRCGNLPRAASNVTADGRPTPEIASAEYASQ